jgi:hypothetical protein
MGDLSVQADENGGGHIRNISISSTTSGQHSPSKVYLCGRTVTVTRPGGDLVDEIHAAGHTIDHPQHPDDP